MRTTYKKRHERRERNKGDKRHEKKSKQMEAKSKGPQQQEIMQKCEKKTKARQKKWER